MIDSTSQVQTKKIADNTRVWQFCVILEGAEIGSDCNICSHCFIENDVIIGDRVTIKCGVQLWDGIRVEDDVFIGPNVSFTNDKEPRSKHYPERFLNTVIKHGASIGANATILPGLTIGSGAMIGAGAVVTHDVPSGAIVVGNPARITAYNNVEKSTSSDISKESAKILLINGVKIYELQHVSDLRGNLSVAEIGLHLPFEPQRLFFVYDVPSAKVRGEHAHKECHQYLICLSGSVSVVVDDGSKLQELVLDRPDRGLHIEPGVWATQYKYSTNAVLAVVASHPYDENDYIRDYDEFLEWKNTHAD